MASLSRNKQENLYLIPHTEEIKAGLINKINAVKSIMNWNQTDCKFSLFHSLIDGIWFIDSGLISEYYNSKYVRLVSR